MASHTATTSNKQHIHYYEIEASSNRDLGKKLGSLFAESLRQILATNKQSADWAKRKELSKDFLSITKLHFQKYVDELEGYAEAANVDFMDLWTLSLEDELDDRIANSEKCSTVIANAGKLVGHNEDWGDGKEVIAIVKKKLTNSGLTMIDLYYYHTLGSNGFSVNSNGVIHGANTLLQKGQQVGVPKNVVVRFLAETSYETFDRDIAFLKSIPRASGYTHNIVFTKENKVVSIESTSTELILTHPTQFPFCHTNHYRLDQLQKWENTKNATATRERLDFLLKNATDTKSEEELIKLLRNQSNGEHSSVFNKRTIAEIFVNAEQKHAWIWLLRESDKDLIKYDLSWAF